MIDENIGKRFGRLTITERVENKIYSNGVSEKTYKCLCDCGNIKITTLQILRRGECKSCGCLHRDLLNERNYKHGLSKTRLYKIYVHMHERCEKEKCSEYNI